MSNPGVIYLSLLDPKYLNGIFRFAVEDNIGEAIHIHINNFRFDLTIKEFLDLCDVVENSLDELPDKALFSIDINKFDPSFLCECSSFIDKLAQIKVEKVRLSDLKCIVHTDDGDILKEIEDTLAYLYLTGSNEPFNNYSQHNHFGQDNYSRLNAVLKSIEHNGYATEENYMVLFDDHDVIRDGQHRAACLKYLGYEDILVYRFYFDQQSTTELNTYQPKKIRFLRIKNFFYMCGKALFRMMPNVFYKLRKILENTMA